MKFSWNFYIFQISLEICRQLGWMLKIEIHHIISQHAIRIKFSFAKFFRRQMEKKEKKSFSVFFALFREFFRVVSCEGRAGSTGITRICTMEFSEHFSSSLRVSQDDKEEMENRNLDLPQLCSRIKCIYYVQILRSLACLFSTHSLFTLDNESNISSNRVDPTSRRRKEESEKMKMWKKNIHKIQIMYFNVVPLLVAETLRVYKSDGNDTENPRVCVRKSECGNSFMRKREYL